MKELVAIQGIKGSFHHHVATSLMGEAIDIVECMTFEGLADHVADGFAKVGVMALENSIAGAILPNYTLIDKNQLHITGEYYLDIQQNLMALPGQLISDIREVHSHPMALLQCMDFLKSLPGVKLVEDEDTALTAKRISEQQLNGIAAIGSSLAASLYKLNILEKSIQNVKNNMTRFVMVEKGNAQITDANFDKVSLKFELEHQKGSLANVLRIMQEFDLNLTKIQSLPLVHTPWRYAFFVDAVFERPETFEMALPQLLKHTHQLKIIGVYKNALL
ncbi:MAG: prephenate dehydratase [Flavobacterium sp.]